MTITKLGIKRLYRLCEYMESLPKSANKHFDMQQFFSHAGDHEHLISSAPTQDQLHACGTTACALGWAVTNPYFRKAGLRLDVGCGDPNYYCVEGGESVFGLGDDFLCEKWAQLFGEENLDKTPKAWAKRVRKLLKEWEAEASAR